MALEQGESAGWGTRHGAEAEALVVPLMSSTRVLGIMIFYPRSADDLLAPQRRRVIEALALSTLTARLGAGWPAPEPSKETK